MIHDDLCGCIRAYRVFMVRCSHLRTLCSCHLGRSCNGRRHLGRGKGIVRPKQTRWWKPSQEEQQMVEGTLRPPDSGPLDLDGLRPLDLGPSELDALRPPDSGPPDSDALRPPDLEALGPPDLIYKLLLDPAKVELF